MWGKKKKENDQFKQKEQTSYPVRSVSIQELRNAIQAFASELQDGVNLSVIIKEDLTLDYSLLGRHLQAIPSENYVMSRETYELFHENDKQLALDIDMIQKAVDRYIKQTNELPIIDQDPYHKVSYFKLEKLNLISYRPKQDFYISDEENMITQIKPK